MKFQNLHLVQIRGMNISSLNRLRSFTREKAVIVVCMISENHICDIVRVRVAV
jgi:hypothetical protein